MILNVVINDRQTELLDITTKTEEKILNLKCLTTCVPFMYTRILF